MCVYVYVFCVCAYICRYVCICMYDIVHCYYSRLIWDELFCYRVLRVVRRKGEEPEVKVPLQDALWSPKNSSLAFVQGGDVYYCLDAVRMPECVVRLTDTGSDVVSNGVPDLIYQGPCQLIRTTLFGCTRRNIRNTYYQLVIWVILTFSFCNPLDTR